MWSDRVERIPLHTSPPVKTTNLNIFTHFLKIQTSTIYSKPVHVRMKEQTSSTFSLEQIPHASVWRAGMHSRTLRVADQVNPVHCILHYWINSCLEPFHLFPHGLQAGASVEQVDDGHVCPRMRLQERKDDHISRTLPDRYFL